MNPVAKANMPTPHIPSAKRYPREESEPLVLSKNSAIVIFTSIIDMRKEAAYAKGARGSSSAAEAINGPPIMNQNTYTLGFSRLVITPLLNDPLKFF